MMNKRKKIILIFSLIYGIIAVIGIIIFSFSFEKVPLDSFGLRANYFNPTIETNYYVAGLYNKGLGFYFIFFPRTKQCVMDLNLTVRNNIQQTFDITYTICYRINPQTLSSFYQQMGLDYEQRIIELANNVISVRYLSLSQIDSRVNAQTYIIADFLSKNNSITSILQNYVNIEALFINNINFSEKVQAQYQASLSKISAYSKTYESAQLLNQQTIFQISSLQSSIQLLKNQLQFDNHKQRQTQLSVKTQTESFNKLQRQWTASRQFQIQRVLQAYNSSKINFIKN